MDNLLRLRMEMGGLVPPEIRVRKVVLYGKLFYIFHHTELGDVGRISIQNITGKTLLTAEINERFEGADRELQEKILFPLVEQISDKMTSFFGN
ncbi:MAG: hypothetical protein KBC00_04580 [Candidatus Levybacteria bacterium]|nr:hypothetical protein [Candidatus Levybacteria bacterium]